VRFCSGHLAFQAGALSLVAPASRHIKDRADDLQRSGLSRPEAERRARLRFGGYVSAATRMLYIY
jgi:hypothetical protein